jgi:hypothetical protein
VNDTERVGILHEHGGEAFGAIVLPLEHVAHLHTDAERVHARAHDLDAMRMAFVGDKNARSPRDLRHGKPSASAQAVPSSSSDAFATSSAVRSRIIVWKLISASRRPCAISA